MNYVRVFRREIINRAGRRRRQTKLSAARGSILARGHTAIFRPGSPGSARVPRLTQMNGHPPLALIAAFSSGLTHNISQRVLI